VNIVTARPLKQSGEKYSFMVKGIHDTSVEAGDTVTPEISGIYSNTFADEKFGVSANFSHSRRDFQRQSANVRSWIVNPDLSSNADVIDNRPVDADGNVVQQFMQPNAEGILEPVSASFFPQELSFSMDDLQTKRTNAQVTLQFAATEDLILTLDHTISNSVTGNNSLGWGMWNGSFGGSANA
jgi:hypothetical protein